MVLTSRSYIIKPWLVVKIIRDKARDIARVEVHSTIHKVKVKEPTFCWSCQFTDAEILKDHNLTTKLHQWYGV